MVGPYRAAPSPSEAFPAEEVGEAAFPAAARPWEEEAAAAAAALRPCPGVGRTSLVLALRARLLSQAVAPRARRVLRGVGGLLPRGMLEDCGAVQKAIAPAEDAKPQEDITNPEENLTTGQMSEIRDILSKSKGADHDQPSSEV